MYITAASSISFQPTFRIKGFSTGLKSVDEHSAVMHPDYSAFIPVKETRRMNDVIKMAITCSADALAQAEVTQPDAIVVGTSMGCNYFTKNFLDKILAANGGLISPTSFMLSTHNTIAGQISLFLGNRNHNMTHTQNSLSFEQTLIDSLLCLREGCNHVLTGAADEMENDLYNIHQRLHNDKLKVACGASFFILSNVKNSDSDIQLIDVGSYGLTDGVPGNIAQFLGANGTAPEEVDLVLYAGTDGRTEGVIQTLFPRSRQIDYQQFSGVYYTNAAFAMHYGIDSLQQNGGAVQKVLVCNNVIPENLGLILLGL